MFLLFSKNTFHMYYLRKTKPALSGEELAHIYLNFLSYTRAKSPPVLLRSSRPRRLLLLRSIYVHCNDIDRSVKRCFGYSPIYWRFSGFFGSIARFGVLSLTGTVHLVDILFGLRLKNIRQGLAKTSHVFSPIVYDDGAERNNPFRIGPHRLTVRTSGFHPGNLSSILRGVTKSNETVFKRLKSFFNLISQHILRNIEF